MKKKVGGNEEASERAWREMKGNAIKRADGIGFSHSAGRDSHHHRHIINKKGRHHSTARHST
jgi:hypothetical protein